jgi:hypothetical protein
VAAVMLHVNEELDPFMWASRFLPEISSEMPAANSCKEVTRASRVVLSGGRLQLHKAADEIKRTII